MNYNSWTSGFIVLLSAIVFTIAFLFTWNLFFNKEKLNNVSKINNKLRYVFIGALLFLLFYCDFIRHFLFTNLQFQMAYTERLLTSDTPKDIVNYADGNFIKLLGNLTTNQAYLYKYLFFGLFTLIYFTICSLIAKLAYPKINTFKFTSFLYGMGTSVVLLIFSLYFFPWHQDTKDDFFDISMEIGHFFQSSLPTLLLLVSFKIYQAYPIENAR